MNETFQYYPMTPDEFEEFRKACVDRMRHHINDAEEYYEKHFPGLERVPWREELAYYRQQDYAYWERLTTQHPGMAKSTLLRYASLSRREAREGVAA